MASTRRERALPELQALERGTAALGGTPARQKASRSTHWDKPLYKESPLAAAKAFAFSQSASAISSSSRCVSSQPKQGSVMDLP